MSSTYSLVLDAAHATASGQNYPTATLYVVATPIGNLADITLRALHTLRLVDRIACEDTRHTQGLLRAYGIQKTQEQLLMLHQHNEMRATQEIVQNLRQGLRIAYVSDAGTPGISDPGARLVASVQAQGLRVMPLPGASSITTLLCAAGIYADDENTQGFVFLGFLPTKISERVRIIEEQVGTQTRAVVILEAPHRIQSLAQSFTALGQRLVTVGRELTKQFEEIATFPAEHLLDWLTQEPQRMRGEFCLVLHPTAAHEKTTHAKFVLSALLRELPLKTAVQLTSDITGEGRKALYARALTLKKEGRPQHAEASHKKK